MAMSQSPEIAVSPLASNILSAVEHVRLAAQQGREKVAEKISGVKIGVLGLTFGSAFLLAACSGEATPAGTTVISPPPTPPDAEMQASSDGSKAPLVEIKPYFDKRADGSDAFTPPLIPEERTSLEQDVDTLVSSARIFFNEEYFKSGGFDLDKIADNLKSLGDDKLAKLSAKWSNHQDFSTSNLTRDGYRPVHFTENVPFSSSFYRDRKTGKITKRHVAFYVDKNGKLLTYRENFPYSPETQDDFTKLLAKLSRAIKVPTGSKPGSTFEDLDWESRSVPEGGYTMSTVIGGDEGNTVISLHGVAGNGLNLVSVSFFAHSAPTPKK